MFCERDEIIAAFTEIVVFNLITILKFPIVFPEPGVGWITLKTTGTRLEAEMMQQMLAAHEIPARVINYGIPPHFGYSTPAALQVRPQDRWTALLLLSPVDDRGDPEELRDEA